MDVAVVIHLQYCNHLIQVELLLRFCSTRKGKKVASAFCPRLIQLLTGGVSAWQRRGLLLKLSGQTQLLEELAEISVDRPGAVTCAADGGWK